MPPLRTGILLMLDLPRGTPAWGGHWSGAEADRLGGRPEATGAPSLVFAQGDSA